MDWDVWGRYFLEYFICAPAAALCFAPVRARLRGSERTYLLAALGAVTLFSAAGAWFCTAAQAAANALLVPALLVFFALYAWFAGIRPLAALFLFFTAAAFMGFCAVFTDIALARVELAGGDGAPTWAAAGMQFGMGALLTAALWRMMERHVGWLVQSFGQEKIWRIVWILPLAFLILFVAMAPQDYNTILVNRIQPLGAVLLLFVLGLMVFLIELFYRVARSLSDAAALREENHFLAAQASQYAALSGYIRQTRTLRHDFRQHLRVIGALAAEGDLDALNAYLKDLKGDEPAEVRFIFANPALNALAGYYDERARTQGIALEWNAAVPEALPIADAELCVLLGNLLENAIDGASALPEGERRVRAICRLSGDMLCVIVENRFDGQVRREKGRFLSTKHAGEGHGLSSVEAAVQRHCGTLSIEAEGGVFRVSLLMNLTAGEDSG